MRLFFAFDLSESTRERVAAVAERLRAWDLPARWTHPADYHITTLFLGDVPEHEAGSIEYSVDDFADSLTAPALRLPGLGAFAGRQAPRIVYAAVEDRLGWCGEVHRDLAEIISHDVEPHFQPHITLCRPDQQRSADPARWRAVFEANGLADWGPCELTDLVLYRSTGGPGPRYEALQRWPI
ncbi:MAG: RNA 2',3'-cyclic phosphodiesterase [Planctomycetota bacterium]